MIKFNAEDVFKKIEETRTQRISLFGKDFLQKLNNYLYAEMKINEIGMADNHSKLFKCHDANLKAIFEYRNEETEAQKQSYPDSTYAVYHFNSLEGFNPIRIEISIAKKEVPECLKDFQLNNKKPKYIVDIEFFERSLPGHDSKIKAIKDVMDFIIDSEENGNWSKENLIFIIELMKVDSIRFEELTPLDDLEKIHMKFLVFGDDDYLVKYLGIGTNQPFSIGEKRELGKNRFYRYSLEKKLEQTSTVKMGEKIKLNNDDIIFDNVISDGKNYAFLPRVGVIIRCGNTYRKALIDNNFLDLNCNSEFKKCNKSNFIKEKLSSLFPAFDGYLQVFYDPMEKINSFGHKKTIKQLKDKGLLGAGWQSKWNVASDLYINGHDDVFRIKPISLLLYHFIEIGELDKMIERVIKNEAQIPIKNT